MSFRPLLRPGLRVVPQPDGGARVVDPPAGLSLDLPAAAAPLLALLDGHLDADEALKVSGAPEDVGGLALRSLALSGCLLGTDEEGRRRRVEARAADEADGPFRLAAGTRFECGACGACCRTVDFGPLTREEMDRLAGAAFVQADPALRGAPLFARADDPADPLGRAHWVLARREGGACVFLDDAGRCRVHLELGPEARPLGCRLFPFEVQRTTDGVVVSDGLGCATFSASAAAGEPVYARFAGLRPVLGEAARRAPRAAGDGVRLGSGVVAPAALVRLATSRALEVMDAAPGPWRAGAAAALGALASFEALVLGEPLGPGLGERVVERLWATPLDVLAAGPDGVPPVAETTAALARLLERLAPVADLPPGAAPLVGDDGPLDEALRVGLRQRLHGLAPRGERRPWRRRRPGPSPRPPLVAAAAGARAASRGDARPTSTTSTPSSRRSCALRGPRALATLRAAEDDATLVLLGGVGLAEAAPAAGGRA
ncbi:MAG: YkgJ family cysteine cluster protein [Planctomycetes bacterium]|nr:YkgJ family cysteine cluster protein [Planctomycetota bacterium]